MFWSILHRTIFWELARVFLMALLGITGILLMAGIVAEASKHGLSPAQILAIIPLIVPSTLPYTIPATTLFATCIVYGRLAHDNEILAIKAAGVNVLMVVLPAVFLGIVMSAVTISLYYYVIPMTHHMMRTMFLNDVEDFLYGILQQDGYIKHPKMNYEMYVKRVVGRKLLDTEFRRKQPNGTYDVIARAREAELHVHMQKKQLLVHMRYCFITSSDSDGNGYVEDKVWPVDLPPDIAGEQTKHRGSDMTWEELIERKETRLLEIDRLDAEIALTSARVALARPLDELPAHIKNLRSMRLQMVMERTNIDVEMQMRPAVGLGCLCFVLVGCPVGIWFSRSDYLSAFITCFLPIVFVYYPLLLCGINLAKSGRVLPALSIWGADAMMALAALVLFRRLLKN